MRIATWNINGLRARFDFVLHWLRERQPDVVGLQELKLTDDQFPLLEFEAEGYQAVSHGQKAWNGVAILSRLPMEPIQTGLPGQHEQGARLLCARLQPFAFATVYCPNGKHIEHPDYPRKLAWFHSLMKYLEEFHQPDDPLILAGDFNLCPSALDSWNEEGLRGQIFHNHQERDRFRGLLQWGLADLYRESFPEGTDFSWWDYRAGAFHRNQGLRIDLLLGTRSIAERVRRVGIDREYRKKKDGLTASDHAPVWADLD